MSDFTDTDFSTLRGGDMAQLVDMLKTQQDVKYDVVVHSSQLHYNDDGQLIIVDGAANVTDDGVSLADAVLQPTDSFEAGISQKLGIPRQYLRRMRDENELQLLAANVNRWLELADRRFFVRGFRDDNVDHVGLARAFLSDSFDAGMDHLDVLLAALDGVKAADVDVIVDSCELTERAMRVNVISPSVNVVAEALLMGYRSPFDPTTGLRRDGRATGRALGAVGHEFQPETVFAGWQLSNSETGGGAFTLVPRVLVKICGNGLVVKRDAMRRTHLGSKLEEGIVQWSSETRKRNAQLVTAQARDVVERFLSADYLQQLVDELEGKASTPVDDAAKTIERVSRKLAYTDDEAKMILDHFIAGGQLTAGGIMQAVTSAAQMIDDADRAYELESTALDVLDLV